MRYQDLNLTKIKITKLYVQNPNRSMSAILRFFRKKHYISFIGDYPLLACVLETIYSLAIVPSRFQVLYAFNQSEELSDRSKKDKKILLDELFNSAHDQTKPLKNLSKETKNKKMTLTSS